MYNKFMAMTNEEMFQDIKHLVQESLDNQTARLEARMDKKFEKIDKRFEQIDKRFEDIDQKLEENAVVQNEILNAVAEKHELIEADLKNHSKRITRLETKVA